jgi:hypothetical protein
MLLVGVFITFLKGFFFGVLAKEFDSAPVHPPPVASLVLSIDI